MIIFLFTKNIIHYLSIFHVYKKAYKNIYFIDDLSIFLIIIMAGMHYFILNLLLIV